MLASATQVERIGSMRSVLAGLILFAGIVVLSAPAGVGARAGADAAVRHPVRTVTGRVTAGAGSVQHRYRYRRYASHSKVRHHSVSPV